MIEQIKEYLNTMFLVKFQKDHRFCLTTAYRGGQIRQNHFSIDVRTMSAKDWLRVENDILDPFIKRTMINLSEGVYQHGHHIVELKMEYQPRTCCNEFYVTLNLDRI
jgi:hypothetical protein